MSADSPNPEPTEAEIIASLAADDEPEPEAAQEQPEGEAEPAEQEQQEQDEPGEEPPEFWSAERKALWGKIPAEFRGPIREHYEEATRATNKKLEDAALRANKAEESAKAALAEREQLAGWWQANGPGFSAMFQSKWAKILTPELAKDNPGEYVRLKAEHDAEKAVLDQAQHVHHQEVQKAQQRAEQAHQQVRAAEHSKLATKFPKLFGTTEAATKTYGELSQFLSDMGIPGDRIKDVYEAPVVEIVKMAYELKQLQAKARTATKSEQAASSASTTPMRVKPGASRGANQGNDRVRQAEERLRNGTATDEDLRWAFR